MNRKIFFRAVSFIALLLFVSHTMAADLYGWLKRSNKANVEIQLKSATNSWKVVSNQNGLYEFKQIPPGNYEILVNNKKSGEVSVKPGQNRYDLK